VTRRAGDPVIVRGAVVGSWRQCQSCPRVYSAAPGATSTHCPGCTGRAVERVATWPQAAARLLQLRQAGYQGQATDMGEAIVIHVSAGKHADLSRLPGPITLAVAPAVCHTSRGQSPAPAGEKGDA